MTAVAEQRPIKSGEKRRRRDNPLAVSFGLVWLVIVLAPLWYLAVTSFRTQSDYLTANPWIPSHLSLTNYRAATRAGFWHYALNSVLVSGAVVLIVCSVGLAASYAITRRLSRPAQLLFQISLACLALPAVAVIVPLYFEIQWLHLYDSRLGIILPLAAFGLPVAMLIFVNFLRDIPTELFDAMAIDGAEERVVLWRLVVPLARPALAIVAVYECIQAWNNLLFPLILTQSSSNRVLPLVMYDFVGQFSMNVPGVLATIVLSSLPLLIVYAIARRSLIGGLAAGYNR
jgi:raffinose/stachyose/melibiose transport system permease protein